MLTQREKEELVDMAVDRVIDLMCAANWGKKQGFDAASRMADGIAMTMLWRREDRRKANEVETPPSEPKQLSVPEYVKTVGETRKMIREELEKMRREGRL